MSATLKFSSPLIILAALAAALYPLFAHLATSIDISLPAAQAAAPMLELEGLMLSTRHGNSGRVITELLALPEVRFTGSGKSLENGTVQIWAGLHPRRPGWATVSILWANQETVWYGALGGPVLTAMIPGGIEVAPGSFVDPATLNWEGAWIMSANSKGANRLLDDPAQYLTLGEGWAKWQVVQAKWGLYTPIAAIPFLPPPPSGGN